MTINELASEIYMCPDSVWFILRKHLNDNLTFKVDTGHPVPHVIVNGTKYVPYELVDYKDLYEKAEKRAGDYARLVDKYAKENKDLAAERQTMMYAYDQQAKAAHEKINKLIKELENLKAKSESVIKIEYDPAIKEQLDGLYNLLNRYNWIKKCEILNSNYVDGWYVQFTKPNGSHVCLEFGGKWGNGDWFRSKEAAEAALKIANKPE